LDETGPEPAPARKGAADRAGDPRARGVALAPADAYIAATHKLTVATRDTAPFEAAGLTVLNPRES